MTTIYNNFQSNLDGINIRNTYDNTIINNKNYNEIYKNLKNIINNKDNRYINFSSDKAISSATLATLNELYSYRCGQKFKSDLKIIYISPTSDMILNNYDINTDTDTNTTNTINYKNSVVSNLISLSLDYIKRSYTKHVLDLDLEQFIFLGLQHIDDENILIESKCKYYPLSLMGKKIQNILENIITDIDKDNINIPVAIVFDINSISSKIYNTNNTNKKDINSIGINIDQINIILKMLSKLNIKMIDIVGYNDNNDNNDSIKLRLLINKIYLTLTNQKNTKVNVFDENSRFLIFKPMSEIYDKEYGVGWYLLRNIPNDMKNEILNSIENDSMIVLNIPNIDDNNDNSDNSEDEVLISSTNILEQNEKCYYVSETYKDCCLYPDEKMAMCFNFFS